MFTFLIVVHAIIAAALVAVILMQRSEGGGLGMGGSPSGLMSARGAADFLTRATTILAILFVLLSVAIAAYATVERAPRTIDTSLARQPAPAADPAAVPLAGDPLAIGGNASAPLEPSPQIEVPAEPVAPPSAPPAPPVAGRAPSAASPQPAPRTPAREAAPPAPTTTPRSTTTPTAPSTVGNPAVSNFSLERNTNTTAPAPAGNGSIPLGE